MGAILTSILQRQEPGKDRFQCLLQHQGTLNKALRRIIRDCNDMQLAKGKKNPVLLPNLSCHSLHQTFTTRLVEAGVNIKVIQELCGHTRSDKSAKARMETNTE